MLTGQDLGLAAMTGVELVHGYIRLFYSISHPRLILADEVVPISRPAEQEAVDEGVGGRALVPRAE
jgi:hypothetical protein